MHSIKGAMPHKGGRLSVNEDSRSSVGSGGPGIEQADLCRSAHCSHFHHVPPLLSVMGTWTAYNRIRVRLPSIVPINPRPFSVEVETTVVVLEVSSAMK